MRLSHVWTTAVIVIVAISGFGLLPAVTRGAASTPAVAAPSHPLSPHPQAAVGVFSTTQYGGTTSDFYVGEGSSQVSFWVYDFGGDGNVTVAIHDYNHTRDGLSDPVYTHRLHIQGGYNYSYQWNLYYQIPLTLAAPGTWNITVNGTLGGFAFQNFTVHSYYTYLSNGQNSVLSGHTGVEEYGVLATINDAPATSMSTITVQALYFKAGNWTPLSGFPHTIAPSQPVGTFPYTVPANITGQIQFMIWANISANSTKWSEVASDSQLISVFVAPLVSLTMCQQGCPGGNFPAGSTLYLAVTTQSVSIGSPVPQPGLHVRISFQRGSTGVSVTGATTNFTSNSTGGVALTFPANTPPFSTNTTNYVVVNVTDPLNPTAHWQTVQVGFDLVPAVQRPRIAIVLDSSTYFGGETATATWSIGTSNGSAPTGWAADTWYVYQENPYLVLDWQSITSTATTGTFQFTVPTGYNGVLYVEVQASNRTNSIYGDTSTWVGDASILLSPSQETYLPGDNPTVNVATQNIPSGAMLLYTVTDNFGSIESAGTVPSNNQIQVHVPTVAPPTDVYVNVVAQNTSTGAVITKAWTEMALGAGLVIVAGVQTKSNYADGSFQPGETITITYAISTEGGAAPPKWFDITVCPTGIYFCGLGSTYVETSATSGTFQYKIPSNTPSGSQEFTVYVDSISCGGYYYCYTGSTFSVPVNPSPAALQYELGAGSGLTVGWLILLVIIVVVALLLFLVGRRRARGGAGGGSGPAKAWSSSDSPSAASSAPADSSGTSGGSGGSSTMGAGPTRAPPPPPPPRGGPPHGPAPPGARGTRPPRPRTDASTSGAGRPPKSKIPRISSTPALRYASRRPATSSGVPINANPLASIALAEACRGSLRTFS